MQQEECMTEMELCHRWRVTPKTLRTMRRLGRAPRWWIVGKNQLRYSKQAVEEWESRNR